MKRIPLNNFTMGWSHDTYQKLLHIRECEEKERQEQEERNRLFEKAAEPYRKELKRLRDEEISKLLNKRKFRKRLIQEELLGHLTGKNISDDYIIEYPNAGCGYTRIDLIQEYGSKEYKEERDRLIKEINSIKI